LHKVRHEGQQIKIAQKCYQPCSVCVWNFTSLRVENHQSFPTSPRNLQLS